MHQHLADRKRSRRVFDSVLAGSNQRSQKRQLNLTAMCVSSKHQIESKRLGPLLLVRAMAKQDSKIDWHWRLGSKFLCFGKPRQCISSDCNLLPLNLFDMPRTANRRQTASRQTLSISGNIFDPTIVIPKNVKNTVASTQLSKKRLDPIQTLVFVNQIPCDKNEIRFGSVYFARDLLEII